MKGKVVSVNISEKKGTVKTAVRSITINELGVGKDAHAGRWHRQVSLLAREVIDEFARAHGKTIKYGDFAENITVGGVDLSAVNLLDRVRVGGAELEVTQIGKECHGGACAIFQEVGRCVMPENGVFCRVLTGGKVRVSDPVDVQERPLNIHVITLSDRAFNGEYADLSGPAIKESLSRFFRDKSWGIKITGAVLPDDEDQLLDMLEEILPSADIIITTGGTGIGPRDITVDVIRPMLEKEIPGIMEFIRVKYGDKFPNALLSRGVAGRINQCLVFTLPGSRKAVEEYMYEINRILEHGLLMAKGINSH